MNIKFLNYLICIALLLQIGLTVLHSGQKNGSILTNKRCSDLPAGLPELHGLSSWFVADSITRVTGDSRSEIGAIFIVSPSRDWSKDSRMLRIARNRAKSIFGIYLNQANYLELQKALAAELPDLQLNGRIVLVAFLDSDTSVWAKIPHRGAGYCVEVISYDLDLIATGVKNATLVAIGSNIEHSGNTSNFKLTTSISKNLLTRDILAESQAAQLFFCKML